MINSLCKTQGEFFMSDLRNRKYTNDLEICDLEKFIEEENINNRLEKQGLIEIFELGVKKDKNIVNIDKSITKDLWENISLIIRDYLNLYVKESMKNNNPTIYRKALYPNKNLNGYEQEYCGTVEEYHKWLDIIEETAKKFDKLLGYYPTQEEVDVAFDSIKKIFLGLWI